MTRRQNLSIHKIRLCILCYSSTLFSVFFLDAICPFPGQMVSFYRLVTLPTELRGRTLLIAVCFDRTPCWKSLITSAGNSHVIVNKHGPGVNLKLVCFRAATWNDSLGICSLWPERTPKPPDRRISEFMLLIPSIGMHRSKWLVVARSGPGALAVLAKQAALRQLCRKGGRTKHPRPSVGSQDCLWHQPDQIAYRHGWSSARPPFSSCQAPVSGQQGIT